MCSSPHGVDRTPGYIRTFFQRAIDMLESARPYELRDGELTRIEIPTDTGLSVHREWLLVLPQTDWVLRRYHVSCRFCPRRRLRASSSRAPRKCMCCSNPTHIAPPTTPHGHATNWSSSLWLTSRLASRSSRRAVGMCEPLLGYARKHHLRSSPRSTVTATRSSSIPAGSTNPPGSFTAPAGEPAVRDQVSARLFRRRRHRRHPALHRLDRWHVDSVLFCSPIVIPPALVPHCLAATAGSPFPMHPGTTVCWADSGSPVASTSRWPISAAAANTGRIGICRQRARVGTRSSEDFAAVATDLVARGITTVAQLGAFGTSSGGLLMGIMLTRYPELFGALVCRMPLLDMRRYHLLLAGASWVAEYGDPDDPERMGVHQGVLPVPEHLGGPKVPARPHHHVNRRRPCSPRPCAQDGRRARRGRAIRCCSTRTSRVATAASRTTPRPLSARRADVPVPQPHARPSRTRGFRR